MRPTRIIAFALATLLFSAANVALADPFLPDDGSGASACGAGKGEECESKTVEECIRWVIVEIKVGTTTSTTRECQQKTTTTTKKYYTTPA